MEKFRRRQFVIKKHMQYNFALVAFILLLVSTISVWLLMSAVMGNALDSGLYSGSIALRSQYAVWGFIVADAVAVFFLTLYFSRYVAGPIYRLEKTLIAMLEGQQVSEVVLRKKDSLQDTAQTINQIVVRWNEMKAEIERLKGRKG